MIYTANRFSIYIFSISFRITFVCSVIFLYVQIPCVRAQCNQPQSSQCNSIFFCSNFISFLTVIVIAELVILFIEFLKYSLFNVIYPPNMFMCCRYFVCFVFVSIWQSIFGLLNCTYILLRIHTHIHSRSNIFVVCATQIHFHCIRLIH